MNNNSTGSLWGGTLLVAGTSIGGGMLALPVLTGLGGFFPSLLIYFFCWLFMACTGLLLLEVCLWMQKESNVITMAKATLGKTGEVAAWGLYLFLFYCLTVAYMVGCGSLILEILGLNVPDWSGPLIFLAIFAPFIFLGARITGKLNAALMLGLGVSFFLFVALGAGHVNVDLLAHKDWSLSLIGLPIAFTSFAYQGIIPTLAHYMHYDNRKIRQAILIGSFIPLAAYAIWQGLILGIVPIGGAHGLEETLQAGHNAIQPLKYFIQSPLVYHIGQYFAFFALVTSFFGVSLGLIDFLADGLKLTKVTGLKKLLLCALVFIPPLGVALANPHIFLKALDFAGGFGCALLLGMMPVLMVWSGRYYLGYKSEWRLPGGKIALGLLLSFVVLELCCEFFL
jgi:tyrosine-specific transport protein